MSFRHLACLPIMFATCGFVFTEFILLPDQSPVQAVRKTCHSLVKTNTHFYLPHACCTKFNVNKNNLSALFALTSDKGKNQTLQTNQSHTLRSHGSMHNFAMFQCKNCFAVECSVLLNAYVYILYNHIKIYTGMHTHTRTHTNSV